MVNSLPAWNLHCHLLKTFANILDLGQTLCWAGGGSVVVVDAFSNFPSIDCVGSVFGPSFVMQYLASFLVLQTSCGGREGMLLYSSCLADIL